MMRRASWAAKLDRAILASIRTHPGADADELAELGIHDDDADEAVVTRARAILRGRAALLLARREARRVPTFH